MKKLVTGHHPNRIKKRLSRCQNSLSIFLQKLLMLFRKSLLNHFNGFMLSLGVTRADIVSPN